MNIETKLGAAHDGSSSGGNDPLDPATTVVPRPASEPAIALAAALEAARGYARASRAASTWRAYRSDWDAFQRWCATVGLEALPATPHTVSLFIATEAEAGKAPATLTRRLAAIRLVHRGAGLASPHDGLEVNTVLQGARRRWNKRPAQKAPALDEDVKRLADVAQPESCTGLRDRALILLGFAGAFRRSELVALDVADLTERDAGLDVRIGRSKTDQEGKGATIAIPRVPNSPYCPVQAVRDWLVVADIEHGAVFRRMHRGDHVGEARLTSQSVALVIKALARKAGLDAARYAGHSLRSGFLTSAARNRASIFKMADQSRHRSLDVLREYVRDEDRFADHAGAGLLK